MQHRYPVVNTVDKDPQFEIEAVVTEAKKYGARLRVFDYQRAGFSGLEQQLFSQFGIGSIGDADGNFNPEDIIGQRPVDQPAGDKLFVGHNQFFAVPIHNGGGPDLNAGDGSADIRDGDGISDSKRSFEKNDQTANEVGDDLL